MGGMRHGAVPHGRLALAVKNRSELYDVSRPDGDSDNTYHDGVSFDTLDTQYDMALGLPTEAIESGQTGQRDTGTLQGLAPTGQAVSLAQRDRIDYMGDTYEVQSVTGIPSSDDPELWSVQLERAED